MVLYGIARLSNHHSHSSLAKSQTIIAFNQVIQHCVNCPEEALLPPTVIAIATFALLHYSSRTVAVMATVLFFDVNQTCVQDGQVGTHGCNDEAPRSTWQSTCADCTLANTSCLCCPCIERLQQSSRFHHFAIRSDGYGLTR